MGIFDSYGIALHPNDIRPMTEAEMQKRALSNWADYQHYTPSIAVLLGQANWQRPERPLDERFADFKIRLAAAIEKHSRVKGHEGLQ